MTVAGSPSGSASTHECMPAYMQSRVRPCAKLASKIGSAGSELIKGVHKGPQLLDGAVAAGSLLRRLKASNERRFPESLRDRAQVLIWARTPPRRTSRVLNRHRSEGKLHRDILFRYSTLSPSLYPCSPSAFDVSYIFSSVRLLHLL